MNEEKIKNSFKEVWHASKKKRYTLIALIFAGLLGYALLKAAMPNLTSELSEKIERSKKDDIKDLKNKINDLNHANRNAPEDKETKILKSLNPQEIDIIQQKLLPKKDVQDLLNDNFIQMSLLGSGAFFINIFVLMMTAWLVQVVYGTIVEERNINEINTHTDNVKDQIKDQIKDNITSILKDAIKLKEIGGQSEIEDIKDYINIRSDRSKWGLVKLHDDIDLIQLFNRLDNGDELLWLDTYCPRFSDQIGTKMQEAVRAAIKKGAKIRMLILSASSEVANWRIDDIHKYARTKDKLNDGEYRSNKKRFKNQLKDFKGILENYRNFAFEQGKEDCFQYEIYDDLPSVPIYILKKKNYVEKVYSGFFLDKGCTELVYIEWKNVQNGLAQHFLQYFNNKWKEWERQYPNLSGVWNYQLQDSDFNRTEWHASGICEIKQYVYDHDNDEFIITIEGHRTATKGKPENTSIPWKSDRITLSVNNKKIYIDYSYIAKKQGAIRKGFINLDIPTYEKQQPISKITEISGHYFLNFSDNDQETRDQNVNTFDTQQGTIVFTFISESTDQGIYR